MEATEATEEEDASSFVSLAWPSLTAGLGLEEVDDEELPEVALVVEDLDDGELEEARLIAEGAAASVSSFIVLCFLPGFSPMCSTVLNHAASSTSSTKWSEPSLSCDLNNALSNWRIGVTR